MIKELRVISDENEAKHNDLTKNLEIQELQQRDEEDMDESSYVHTYMWLQVLCKGIC